MKSSQLIADGAAPEAIVDVSRVDVAARRIAEGMLGSRGKNFGGRGCVCAQPTLGALFGELSSKLPTWCSWLSRLLHMQKVSGSNPADGIFFLILLFFSFLYSSLFFLLLFLFFLLASGA